MQSRISGARSFLFAPASRPARFIKALESGADCVILDLEDAVAPDEKNLARDHLADRLPGFTRAQLARTLVRINATDTAWHIGDLNLVREWVGRGLAGVLVPKAEAGSALRAIGIALGPRAQIVPLIESLAGLDGADLMARTPQVVRLAFGHLDFQLDMGMRCEPEETELAFARFQLVAASRRQRLPPPIDGVTTEIGSGERLLRDVQRARACGFGGKLGIHPAQVATINEAFSATEAELAWARRVVAGAQSHNGQAFSLDGKMVDLPVIRAAERTLQQFAAT